MAIQLSTGEIVCPLDLVTTAREIVDTFPISRGMLRNAMLKDKFEWTQISRTVIIDRETFLEWWSNTPSGQRWLDMQKQKAHTIA